MTKNSCNYSSFVIERPLQKSDENFRLSYVFVGCSVGAADRVGWFVG